jgi:hypothetical protein
MAIRESRKIGSVALAVCLLFLTGARAEYGRALDQTINEVAREAATKLKQTGFEDIKNIAVLPLWGDCDPDTKNYIVNTIQSEIIGGPYRVMERNTQAWDTLLGEIEWGSLREDIMNADTVQRFGRIEGCDAIVYGTVRECAEYPMSGRAVTRLTLKMGVVETGEAKWSSGEIKSVRIVGATAPPRPDMDPAIIRAINELTGSAVAGLKGKNVNTASFAFFPLLGQDDDGYFTEVLQAELTKAGCNPAPVSRAEWQEYLVANSRTADSVQAMRDFAKTKGYDSFLYGTVNECRIIPRKYKALARATLTMVGTETGEAVWSPGEIRGEARLDWQDILAIAVHDPIAWVLGGIIILLIVWRAFARLFKSATRPR